MEDDRLRELWNGVQNPVVSQPLVLVSTEGRRLLGSLGISAGAEDSAADGAAEGADDDIVETHRKKTHYRGGESIRLQRKCCVLPFTCLIVHVHQVKFLFLLWCPTRLFVSRRRGRRVQDERTVYAPVGKYGRSCPHGW